MGTGGWKDHSNPVLCSKEQVAKTKVMSLSRSGGKMSSFNLVVSD